jgi:hypothetical protein
MAVRSVRRFGAIVVVTLVAAGGCAASGTVVRTVAAEGPSTLVEHDADVTARLDAKTAVTAGALQHSPILTIDGRSTAVLLIQNGLADRRVQVLVDDNGWRERTTLRVPEPKFDLDGARDIEVDDVTGDGVGDFLVPLTANHTSALLVSSASGQWELVPFVGVDGETEHFVEVDPHLVNGTMTSMDRVCVPNCAQGGQTPVTWAYRDGAMVRIP